MTDLSNLRRTKIVSTIGPAYDRDNMLEKVFKAGVDVFRANFSHGSHEAHAARIKQIRDLSKKEGREVAIFADLQGPKIRVARFKEGSVNLIVGDEFILDADYPTNEGDQKIVGLDYKDLPKDLSSGDRLLLDDGRVVLTVKEVKGSKVFTTVTVGGKLSNNKGINREGGGLSAEALTDKDKADIKFAATLEIDYFAISFPRDAADMIYAKKLIREAGSDAGVIAKVERAEAVDYDTLDGIIEASDVIMVARGDLGVEIGDENLPVIQKHMIKRCRQLNTPVITATQMMETMIHNKIPTRAEVFDVANAVLDYTDSVMLSAETATGDHPDLVVSTVSRICKGAEAHPRTRVSKHRLDSEFTDVSESIAMGAVYIANHMKNIKAIVSLTETGTVPLWLSRIRSAIPFFALTRHIKTQRRVNMYRGVYPVHFDPTQVACGELDDQAIQLLKDKGLLEKGDMVLITKGGDVMKPGYTDSLKIYEVV